MSFVDHKCYLTCDAAIATDMCRDERAFASVIQPLLVMPSDECHNQCSLCLLKFSEGTTRNILLDKTRPWNAVVATRHLRAKSLPLTRWVDQEEWQLMSELPHEWLGDT